MGAYKVDTFTIYTEFWSAIRAFEEFMADGNARFSHGDHDFVLRREKPEEWSIVETESNRPWGVFVFRPGDGDKTEFGAGSRGSYDETYEAVSFYVEKFMGYLREKELLYPPKPAQPVKTNIADRKTLPGGRPSNADDDWAWHQVNILGRSRKEVYPEWLQRIGSRAETVADPHDSFNHAVNPSKKKQKKSE